MESGMALEFINILMAHTIGDNSKMITDMAMDSIRMQPQEISTMATITKVKGTVLENI